jgi:hypothetical protein
MVTHQGCPQTPGGRIRALGFASTKDGRTPSRIVYFHGGPEVGLASQEMGGEQMDPVGGSERSVLPCADNAPG